MHFLGAFSAIPDSWGFKMIKERLLGRPGERGKGKGWTERFTVNVLFGERKARVTYELWAKNWKDGMQ